jgi:polar amino acid transport system permease protein
MTEYLIAIQDALPYLLQGALVTIALVLGALFLGLILGVILAVGQVYGNKAIRAVVAVYVWFFRGIPLLVLLFLFYFGLFTLLGINISAFTAAVIVLGLISAAYQSQIFRAGIQSLPEGQFKAARALGMSDARAVLFDSAPGLAAFHSGLVQ